MYKSHVVLRTSGVTYTIGNLTLRRPNFLGAHVPVTPDLAKTVKEKSDHSENLTRVLDGAKNGKII